MSLRNLDALLTPRSVVLIGASTKSGSVGLTIARNLLRGGFKGPIGFVNPHHREIEGHPCHASVEALGAAPDLAIIATPAATLPEIVGHLATKGTRAGVVVSAGLDVAQTRRMLDAGRPHLFRVLGPNGIGLLLPHLGLDASFSHRCPAPGDLAFVSQSGALVTSVIDWAAENGVGFSHVISLGNMADVDFGDLLDYLAGDPSCRAILLYMEAVTEAPKFLSAARRAARAKPVVVIKSGRHAVAAQAAASHTGRLAGSDAAYEAAFRRAGMLRVYDLPELFEAAEILSHVPHLASERLMILTNGGGAGVLVADRLADFGGQLATLSDETRTALSKILPPTWSQANPVDIIGDAGVERTTAALEILLADPDPAALLVINCPTALASSTDIAEAVVASVARHRQIAIQPKPVLANWLGTVSAKAARRLFADNDIASFETPDAAARGLMHLVRYSRAQDALMRTPAPMGKASIDHARAEHILRQAGDEGRTMLSEPEAKSVLTAYGIPVVETVVAADPIAVGGIAARLLGTHTAVAVKILSRDISHKSDFGGVHLDLTSATSAQAAAADMLHKIRALKPDARMDGFTVSPMIKRRHAHELIVGMSVDATFGPLLMFGAGGTAVEVMQDTALALPPLDGLLAHDLMRHTRIYRLLEGYRDRPPADLTAIADVLVRVGQLVADHPGITEIDINPLLANEAGVIALDVRIVILRATDAPRPALAIRPYPSEWEKVLKVDGTGDVLLRPIRPEDEALYTEFMAHVAPEDHRLRFFSAKQSLSHRLLARLTQIDYARDMAFVAVDTKSGQLLGVARYSADPDRLRAEYAILVRTDFKGHGLGWTLMQHLIDHAKATDVGELYGSVLAENTTMLRMCREFGFAATTCDTDRTLCDVVLRLVPPR
jgi:acetyltransferase